MPLIQSLFTFFRKKYFHYFFFIGIFFLGIAISFYGGYIWFVYPDRGLYPIMGIDVSHHQGAIDWEQVRNDDIGFVYIKATEGDDWTDKNLDVNYQGVKKVGIPLGFYHFYSLRISAKEQTENIIRTLSGKTFELPIVIDLEFGGNSKVRPGVSTFQKDLQEHLDAIEKFQKTKPILYTTYEFQDTYLKDKFLSYPVWIRDVVSHPNTPTWMIWQYKDRGSISGIDGFVGQNVLSGSLDDLMLPRK